jgi:hypothetical protein
VSPNPLKAGGAIMKGMCHNPNFGFGERDKPTLKKGVRKHFTLLLKLSIVSFSGKDKPLLFEAYMR